MNLKKKNEPIKNVVFMSSKHIKFYDPMIYHSMITLSFRERIYIFREWSQSQFNFTVFYVCREHFNHRSVSIFKEKKIVRNKKKIERRDKE